jgi:hypothetical protein
MVTDPRPRSITKRTEHDRSDKMASLPLPSDSRLHELALGIESALSSKLKAQVRNACNEWLADAARFYNVPRPTVRVLDARPLRVYETGVSELFGDYQVRAALIRVWMRTAIKKRVTSSGTFLNTLCHEFCHHLDILRLGFPSSFHTRGFYERTAVLYHHCCGTPFRPLIWRRILNNRWQIDWGKIRRLRVRID